MLPVSWYLNVPYSIITAYRILQNLLEYHLCVCNISKLFGNFKNTDLLHVAGLYDYTCVIECSRHRFGGYIKPFGGHSRYQVLKREQETPSKKLKWYSSVPTAISLLQIFSITMVFLKVTDGNETRKFRVTSELTFDQLKERLTGLFPSLGEGKDLQLQYRDTEGDLITLSSNEELQEVLADTPDGAVLKLHIKTSVQEPLVLNIFSEPFWRPFGLLSWHGFHQELREAEELIKQRRRQCERARTASQEKNKATDSKVQEETPTEPSGRSVPPNVPADESQSKEATPEQSSETQPSSTETATSTQWTVNNSWTLVIEHVWYHIL